MRYSITESILFAIVGICAFLLFSLIGYSIYDEMKPPNITEGEIVELNHEDAYSQLIMIPITISNGKTSTTMMQPTYVYYPEMFEVVIRDGEKREDFYLEQSVFENLNIGDRFRFDKLTMKNNRPEESRDATPEEEEQMKQ